MRPETFKKVFVARENKSLQRAEDLLIWEGLSYHAATK